MCVVSRFMGNEQETAGNLRAALGRKNISRAELARMLGENEMWVGRRLNGQTSITTDDLLRFARALDIPAADLLVAS